MDRIWQWAWDRYGARYSWAFYAITFSILLSGYLFWSFVVVAFEGSGHYVEAAAVTVVTVLVMLYVMLLPGLGPILLAERWAAGHEVDRATALDATYTWARGDGRPSSGRGHRYLGRPAIGCSWCDRWGDRVRGLSGPGFWAPSSELPTS